MQVFNRKQLSITKQSGRMPSFKRDAPRSAMLPGKRISRNGNVYWETRRNRSDALNRRI